ncbi:MAG: RNA 2',3'-cyclic phosphodiesterase [Caldimicrobium sp.]|nr:RNA 2',3'-cyclic phosphodiesterase [Caldimicrobium sp.]MCX7612790.1 RNA 2',3'-cyclic phosphodiesterase [Caldimicrobium sp.]MDW8182142.1 RNA 2',3'-cyclic phosphodiesterase [Caldimicrobium sp.]
MVRAFLAIDLPGDLKREIYGLSKLSIPQGLRVKWVEEHNLHLTLKFFGNISEALVDKIRKSCEKKLKDEDNFTLSLEEVGFFPERGIPRVLWIGLSDDSGKLESLSRSLKTLWKELKIEEDKDRFHPHITIIRVKEVLNKDSLKEFIEKLKLEAQNLKGRAFLVKEVVLFKSDLHPSGPRYTALAKIPLSQGLTAT